MSCTMVDTARSSTQGSEQELDHYVCCRDFTRTLCSSPAQDELVLDTADTGNPMCIVCTDLDRAKFCPAGKTCPTQS